MLVQRDGDGLDGIAGIKSQIARSSGIIVRRRGGAIESLIMHGCAATGIPVARYVYRDAAGSFVYIVTGSCELDASGRG